MLSEEAVNLYAIMSHLSAAAAAGRRHTTEMYSTRSVTSYYLVQTH